MFHREVGHSESPHPYAAGTFILELCVSFPPLSPHWLWAMKRFSSLQINLTFSWELDLREQGWRASSTGPKGGLGVGQGIRWHMLDRGVSGTALPEPLGSLTLRPAPDTRAAPPIPLCVTPLALDGEEHKHGNSSSFHRSSQMSVFMLFV